MKINIIFGTFWQNRVPSTLSNTEMLSKYSFQSPVDQQISEMIYVWRLRLILIAAVTMD